MNDPTDGPGLVRSLLPVTYGSVVALAPLAVVVNGSGPPAVRRHLQRSSS